MKRELKDDQGVGLDTDSLLDRKAHPDEKGTESR